MPHPSQVTPLTSYAPPQSSPAPGVDPSRPGEEFEDSVNQEKVNSLNLSLKSVQKGIEETQVNHRELVTQVMCGSWLCNLYMHFWFGEHYNGYFMEQCWVYARG